MTVKTGGCKYFGPGRSFDSYTVFHIIDFAEAFINMTPFIREYRI